MLSELGQIGPIVLRTYSLILSLSIVLSLALLAWQGQRQEDAALAWLDSGLAGVLLGLIGARALHVTLFWSYFVDHQNEIWQIWRGGLNWHGALIGGLVGVALMANLRKASMARITDVLAFLLPIGGLFIHLGCLSTRCGHGQEVGRLVDPSGLIVMELPDFYGVIAPRIASQLYGMILSAIVLGIAIALALMIRREGLRLWPIVSLLGLGAFAIGFTRGDPIFFWGTLRADQVFDLVIVGLGVVSFIIALVLPAPKGQLRSSRPSREASA
ncbi:MAG: hypothetical protein GYB68_15035 [Chloroflexi bacterium]|nr:hypothetical protein [Chloroflexota bacterium]